MLRIQKAIAVSMSFLLVLTTFPVGASAQNASPSGTAEERGTLSSEELDGIVAPIALYPDALVAQILGAATFPYEIVDATLWLKDNSQVKGEALAKAVDEQSWDPAVKALTQFPSVLDNLAKNLAWTSALGEASATQQSDVMAAVQRMRAKAQAAGNLKSSPEIKVVQESPQTIVIQPANPQIVYVPVYNPAVIYGVPYVYPGYVYVAPPPSTAVIAFGVGIAVGAMIYGGCCGWGWSYWGTNWRGNTIVYNRNIYVGNSYWRGGYTVAGIVLDTPRIVPGLLATAPAILAMVVRRLMVPAIVLPLQLFLRVRALDRTPQVAVRDRVAGRRLLCRRLPQGIVRMPQIALPVRGQALARQRLRGIVRTRPRVHDPARMRLAVISVHRPLAQVPRKPLVRMYFQDRWVGVIRAREETKA
jgi:hypothetical protein